MSALPTQPIDAASNEKALRRLCALLTCFNRRDKTLASLQALQDSVGLGAVRLEAVLVDDGSSDGTADAVRQRFPWVHVVVNEGRPYFWCRGMNKALAEAIKRKPEVYLLLNDDTMLQPDALARLLACERQQRAADGGPLLIVGSTKDERSGLLSYGGQRQIAQSRPTSFQKVQPGDAPERLHTFNGNIVLMPADAVARVGNLDPVFEHGMGDFDYGLRARRAGVGLWLAPGFHGTCNNNPEAGTFKDDSQGVLQRWRQMLHRKGLPWRSWLHFTRRHTSWRWPVFFLWPYFRFWTEALGHLAGRRR